MSGFIGLLYLFSLLLVPHCASSRKPIKAETPLELCCCNGTVCCNSAEDLELHKEFEALNVSDPSLKLALCAKRDKFSAHLSKIDPGHRNIPVLCNSTANCGNRNSPFAPSTKRRDGPELDSSPSTMTRKVFCESLGGEEVNDEAPGGLCLEKIGHGNYVDMVPHPDGSNRAFLYNLQGKIWLATLGSNESMLIDESKPFLDLSDQIVFNTMFGLTGLAFHPNFVHNGRLFASFNCDRTVQAGCSGRCACNTDVNCDPSKLGDDTCRYHIVVAEFTVNGTSVKVKPSMAEVGNPEQVTRILTMGLPYGGNHAGQILFGPADGFLYITVCDVSHDGHSYNFAQNKKSLLGKIWRIDVDHMPTFRSFVREHELLDTPALKNPSESPVHDELASEFPVNTSVRNSDEAPEACSLSMLYSCVLETQNQELLTWRTGIGTEFRRMVRFEQGKGGARDSKWHNGGYTVVSECNCNGTNGVEATLIGMETCWEIRGATEINNLELWGNYSIPKDNPYSDDKELAPEIWALGFRNIWRCSFDSERPSYFMCADSGKEQYEEVDIVVKGGNYGWPVLEGPFHNSYGANTSSSNFILPVMGYRHSELGKDAISVAITGGYFYRSMTDPCTYGRYLYTDLYAGAIWAGTESPPNSGNFTTARVPYKCAHDSPIRCNTTSLGYVFSFAQDANKDLHLLSSNGLYRVSPPSRCNYFCSKENVSVSVSPVFGISFRSPPVSFVAIFCLVTCNLLFILFK